VGYFSNSVNVAVIQHAVEANFVFQQLGRPVYGEGNTLQLLQCKTLVSPSGLELELNSCDCVKRFMESYSSVNINYKSEKIMQ